MKRVFPILLSFILVFNISVVSVHAESTSSDWPAVFDQIDNFAGDTATAIKTFGQKVYDFTQPTVRNRLKVIDTITGCPGVGIAWLKAQKDSGETFSNACDTIINDVTQNNDGVWVADNATATFIENYYSNSNDVSNGTGGSLSDIGYVDGIIPSAQYLDPNWYSDSRMYWAVKNFMLKNPDYLYNLQGDYFGNGSIWLLVSEMKPYAAVLPQSDWGKDIMTGCTLYNEYWNSSFSSLYGEYYVLEFTFVLDNNIKIYGYPTQGNSELIYEGSPNGDMSVLDEFYDPSVQQTYFGNSAFPNVGLLYNSSYDFASAYGSGSLNPTWFYGSTSNLSVPVFKDLASLKRGTVGKTTTTLLPSYNVNGPNMSGVTAQQVQQADEIINNFYSPSSNSPGGGGNGNGGNGSGDNGSGSGSGIWDTLANAINGLLTVLGGLISGLVSGLTEVLTSLGGFFTGVLDLANNGVLGLFQAFFPFVPEEWFTVVGLAIGVAFLVFIIKVFKG